MKSERNQMLSLTERIDALDHLGDILMDHTHPNISTAILRACQGNPWFTPNSCRQSLEAIGQKMLTKPLLRSWIARYDLGRPSKNIGIILAGNIPLVGFHDVLASFICGHKVQYKCSHKDNVLLPSVLEQLFVLNPCARHYFVSAEHLAGFDAVIATGSDTASTHFDYYFRKYPSIIRGNRSSIAILNGQETIDELHALGRDIFDYFGLGCRNVSKLYIPKGLDLNEFFEGIEPYHSTIHHNAYKNNFDYTFALYSMAQIPFLTNNVLILKEDASLAGRISSVHFEYYEDINTLIHQLKGLEDKIQCISTNIDLKNELNGLVRLGECQKPGLMDYADGVDVMKFLTESIYDTQTKS